MKSPNALSESNETVEATIDLFIDNEAEECVDDEDVAVKRRKLSKNARK
jgi:hypothetical protein